MPARVEGQQCNGWSEMITTITNNNDNKQQTAPDE